MDPVHCLTRSNELDSRNPQGLEHNLEDFYQICSDYAPELKMA